MNDDNPDASHVLAGWLCVVAVGVAVWLVK